MWRKENPVYWWWECKLVQPLWKTVWKFLNKIKNWSTIMIQQFHSWVFFFLFWPHCTACGILVPWPGIEPGPPGVKVLTTGLRGNSPLLGIYPKKTKTLIRKDTCTPVLTSALFTVAKIWKQPKCPSVDEWIRKIYTHTCVCVYMCVCVCVMEYYSAIKKN